jgi:DNA sulfur modification protein DndD
VKALYEKREMREGQLDEKKKRRGKVIDGAKDILLDAGPAVYSYSALTFAQDELDRLSEKGELPPKIQQQFIDELIERGECICGESLDENPKKVENLLELQNEVTTITQENFEGKPEIKNLLNRMEEKTEDLLEERQELTAIEGDIEGINSELSEVKEALQTADVPEEVDVGALEAQREELRDQRDKLIARRSRVTDDISDLESKKTTKETELREEVKKEERYQELSKKLEFVDAAIRDLEGIRSQILSDIRGRTESNIDGYFNELIWKEQEYNIQLTEDYHLRVLDEHGENQLGSLSAGETQVLALSFMAALSQISGFQAPILIDTPLGRISGEPKKKIAQSLPDYLDDSQVTFLMTDQEYSADVRGLMENEVDREYQLDFADGKTEVVDLA